MSDMTTIARPYAKAIFEIALAANQLAEWSVILTTLAQTMSLPEAMQFVTNPKATAEMQSQFLWSVVSQLKHSVDSKQVQQMLSLLAENKRLLLITGIHTQYELLRAEQEGTIVVYVSSFTELTETQQKRLVATLTKRLQRQVSLEISIDKSLLGGALIQAGDLVIDGSVRGQLTKLATSLAA